jgi:hypothetical protein
MSTIEVKPTTAPDGLKFTPSPQAALVLVITVDPTANQFTPRVTPPKGKVPASSPITLKSAVSNLTAQVYTYNENMQPIQAFTDPPVPPGSQPHYAATPDGKTYTLAATGTIILSLSSTLSVAGDDTTTDPKNGMINVGA